MTSPHTTPPLAQQLRSLAASAPTLVAAADAVEECARLRAERDAARARVAALEQRYDISANRGIEAINRAERAEAERDEARALALRDAEGAVMRLWTESTEVILCGDTIDACASAVRALKGKS